MLSLPDQLRHAITVDMDIQADFRNVCICGLGGSAISGDVIVDHCSPISSKPVCVVRGVSLPSWADSDTLVLAISYSGNTKETLTLFNQGVDTGCIVIGLSSGGSLEERCKEEGLPHFKIPSGMQPRCAVGFIIGYLANILETLGLCGFKGDIISLLPRLEHLRDELSPDNPGSPAKELAERTGDKVPVIYSHSYMSSSSLRWKNQVNENAKGLAFSGSMPEFNHNEIVAWCEDDKSPFIPIFIHDPDAPSPLREMMDMSLEVLRENGVEPEVVTIEGDSIMEKNLRSMMFGDLYSLHLAFLRGHDPAPVMAISSLKEKLLSRLG